jgi:subtilisin family serine protease
MRALRRGHVILVGLVLALVAAAPAAARGTVEVVVTLKQPSLAHAATHDRALASVTMSKGRVDFRSPSSISYLALIRREQDAVAARIATAIPGARVHWRYAITLNGLAVVVPSGKVAALARVPGVAKIWSSATYHSKLDRTPALIGATALWGPTLATAGQGMKIGIIDEGVDQTHPFLSPVGFTMPAGFPKGDTAFTTAKVIVARAFAPPTPTWKYATLPFDPENSEHATHVAGIAAGDNGTRATGFSGSPILSGIAPAAYIGNYKALTIPTPGVGLDGNAPEIAKAIEQAVADGMDVINLSIGEPEIEPSRDLVVQALNGAAAAGVVPVVAAGNDFDEFGRGSVGSPGDASGAITVAASTGGHASPNADIIAGFSSSGPTPYSLQLKPDVTAPGVGILSSVPTRAGTWAAWDGTSMATPHVAGAAALLRQRHPTWTVAQVKSALAQTGAPVYGSAAKSAELSPLREGGGRIDLVRANNPLVFAAPSNVSFGMLRPGASSDVVVTLADAGGGAGVWNITLSGNAVTTPATATVPGPLTVHASVPAGTPDGDSAGFVVLTRGSDVRRIPFWLHVESPKLGPPSRTLLKTGTYAGDTRKGRSSVDSYRFPEPPGIPALAGPEQVFAFKLTRTVANIGARVVSQQGAAKVTPRMVRDGDENRLTGYTGLPGDFNPYRSSFGSGTPVVAAILPARGTYDVVFDSVSSATAGRFTFRFWVNDFSPPTVKLRGYSKGVVTLSVADTGSGVDSHSLSAAVDGVRHDVTFAGGLARIKSGTLARGSHKVTLVVSDFQESKNMEDVARILPNTRFFSGTLKLT